MAFNELTLALQITLLTSLYLFLLFAVRTISKDLSAARGEATAGGVPRIVVVEGDVAGGSGSIPVVGQVLIGRAPDCDIILEDTFASAHHARVYSDDSAYWLEDLGSTNGTAVKGKRIEEPVRLPRGSRFKIGQTVFQFMD
ncbi:MAG: FHA domain-containing protein [Actinobacteria bacterium]|nr:FHA domain-containing protein [Actinomycetota bacterium]